MLTVDQQGPSLTHKLASFGYNGLGQFTTISRGTIESGNFTSVIDTAYGYDEAHRLNSLIYSHGVDTQAAYSWGYDAGSRLLSQTDGNDTLTYTYDATNQLLSASPSSLASSPSSYSYDATGNATSSSTVIGPGNTLQTSGNYAYTYDAAGNRTSKTDLTTGDVTSYTWDYRQRLTQEVQLSSTGATLFDVRYTHDVFNNRTSRQLGAGAIEYFVYDGGDVLVDLSAADSSTAPTLSAVYLHGPQVDQLLAQENVVGTSSTVLWQNVDHLGSVRSIADSTGTIIATLNYDPFGLPDEASITIAVGLHTRYLYTSREYDSATGEQANRARIYDPIEHRWITPDPIEDDKENTYRYVGNSVTIATDPSGLAAPIAYKSNSLDDLLVLSRELNNRIVGPETTEPRPFGTSKTLGEQLWNGVKDIRDFRYDWAGYKKERIGDKWHWTYEKEDKNTPPNRFRESGNPAGSVPFVEQAVKAAEGDIRGLQRDFSTIIPGMARTGKPPAGIPKAPIKKTPKPDAPVPCPPTTAPASGQKVYRVYGGDSKPGGASWTPVNPASVPNYRDAAGLPTGNTGRFVIEGTIQDPSKVIKVRPALPLDGNKGGLPEYIIPNGLNNGGIKINKVGGANPEL